jgi:hypothetical protein
VLALGVRARTLILLKIPSFGGRLNSSGEGETRVSRLGGQRGSEIDPHLLSTQISLADCCCSGVTRRTGANRSFPRFLRADCIGEIRGAFSSRRSPSISSEFMRSPPRLNRSTMLADCRERVCGIASLGAAGEREQG